MGLAKTESRFKGLNSGVFRARHENARTLSL